MVLSASFFVLKPSYKTVLAAGLLLYRALTIALSLRIRSMGPYIRLAMIGFYL